MRKTRYSLVVGKPCPKCGEPTTHFHGDRSLCVKHYRFETMRNSARNKHKYIPSHEELEALAEDLIARGMKCEACQTVMEWSSTTRRKGIVSLQHDRSGKIRFLCMGCNVRHASFPGDTFYDFPFDWGYCWQCCQALPPTALYARKAGSYCRSCRKAISKKYWGLNGDQYEANRRSKSC